MRKLLLILLSVLIVGMAWGESKKVKGTGYLLVVDRPTDKKFTKVSVQQGITLYLAQAEISGITVEADDNILPYIKTEVNGGQLSIFIDSNVVIQSFTAMNVTVNMPVITDINVATAARLIGSEPLKVNKLDIVVSEAGDVKLEVKGSEVDVEASGAARLELKGEVDRLELDLSSSASLKAWELHVGVCDADISGAAKAEVYVLKRINAEVTASGLLIYDGKPKSITKSVSSGGALVKRR